MCLLLKFIFSGNRGIDLLALLQHPLTSIEEKEKNNQCYKELTYALFDVNLPNGVEAIRENLAPWGEQVLGIYNALINKLTQF